MIEQTQPPSRLWRILQFPLVRIVLAFTWLIAVVATTELAIQLLPARETAPVTVLSAGLVVLTACLSYSAFVRIVEKRPATELAASGAVAELASGILLGAMLFTATIGILWSLGYYKVTGMNNWLAAAPVFAGAVISGVVEEILFRGILFRIAEQVLGTWLALLISALLFGLLHLFNPNATWVAAIAIALEAGILLAAAYVLTRRLWFAIGVHFAWNFTQGGIFGVAVSGNQAAGLLQATLTGPELLSGGEFGAEASIFAVAVCLTAGAYLLWRAQNKGNFVRPLWGR